MAPHGTKELLLDVNGKQSSVDVDPTTPLLWVLRETLGLTGTKYGCGVAQCGACTVHVDGQARRSCVTPVSAVAGRKITTIEGLAADAATGSDSAGSGGAGSSAARAPNAHAAVLQAWIAEEVPQCGWCQTGQIMSAAVLLAEKADPTDKDIDAGMAGNVCRCGTYQRIRRAIHRAAGMLKSGSGQDASGKERR